MLMIITALYCEAKPFIEQYHLKKNERHTKFQVFEKDEILLLITEPGSIAAAVGVSYLCTLHSPSASDFLVNIGVCGTWSADIAPGSIFLCYKLTEEATNRSFYPDVVYRHPFEESSLVTVSSVVHASEFTAADTSDFTSGPVSERSLNRSAGLSEKGTLFDMEAAAIYQAASYFLQPHQLIFLKLVSDYGVAEVQKQAAGSKQESGVISPDRITVMLQQQREGIVSFLNMLGQAGVVKEPVFTPEEEAVIKPFANALHCSVTMEYQLRQQLHYYKLVHGDITATICEFCFEVPLPCKSKKEGMKYLEQFRARII
jgi:nucleoside phosphorylase